MSVYAVMLLVLLAVFPSTVAVTANSEHIKLNPSMCDVPLNNAE